MELRCDSKLHGILRDGDVLEVKCGSSLCGHGPGVVILHRFNLHTGVVETLKYKDPGGAETSPEQERSKTSNGHSNQRTAVRSA